MFALPYRRDLAIGVLRYLARLQGRVDDPRRDEEPGRILHEVRQGEIVRTGGGFGTPYYGSVDATPLFVWLAAEAARWMPDAGIVEELEPALRAALRWMDERGDLDGDGFIEYRRRAPRGIENQVWKDSHDSLIGPDGRRPRGPIAAVEVQAYAYAAWRALAGVLREQDPAWARSLDERAARMRTRFERAFWMPETGLYAQALDGSKRQIRDVTSNPGHVLWSGIASRTHGQRTALRLRAADLASGWGLRTRSSRSAQFQPGSYHNGSVWPHDTAIAAAGMARYGATEAAASTIGELREAAHAFPDYRLPELFGGERRDGAAPVSYRVACSPQAWTAAAAFLCVRTMLGLEVSDDGRSISLDPLLPEGVDAFEAIGLRVGSGTLDVRLARRGGRAAVGAVLASGVEVHRH
jgi:glycogen debranching enzyme